MPASLAVAERLVTILVSIDGFRPDYLDRGLTPNLSRLAATGASGPMRPSFPSKTFPNHWTLVTGVVPDRHGIVGNAIDDPTGVRPRFTMATTDPWWWNAAEPIWVTAERAGIPTATLFWPGSAVAWGGDSGADGKADVTGGTRPRDWQAFDKHVSDPGRVRSVIDWLRRPLGERPRFVTLYFDIVDTAGHDAGPDSAEVNRAIAEVDARIGELLAGLATLAQPANLVIVSDHGMAATSSTRTIALDRIVSPADGTVVDTGPYATLTPVAGHEAALERALLARHAHMECWRKDRLPARFRYGRNPRVLPYLCLAEPGWTITKTAPEKAFTGGTHGYDPADPTMRSLFIANGPAFRRTRLPVFDNVDVAPLLRTLLGLPADPSLDGTDRVFRPALRRN